MVKHTQTINLQQPTNCLSVFDHFVGLALKGLRAILKNVTSAFHNADFHFHFFCVCDTVFEISLAKSVFSKVEISGLKNNSWFGA